jgi:hypothetical protein
MEIGGGNMEGIIFYWFSWIGWIVITFFMKKDNKRYFFSIVLLCMIIGSIYDVSFYEGKANLAFLLLIITCYFLIAQESKRRSIFPMLFHSILITIATVCFQLFAIYDPIWVMFDQKWMLSFLVVYLALILAKTRNERLLIAVVGLSQGELLFALVGYAYRFPIQIGYLSFLDLAAIIIVLISSWNGFEQFANVLEQAVQRKQARKAGVNQ